MTFRNKSSDTHREDSLLVNVIAEHEAAQVGVRHCCGDRLGIGAPPEGYKARGEGQEHPSHGSPGACLGQHSKAADAHEAACTMRESEGVKY